MPNIDVFSENNYVFLPSRRRCKHALAIGDRRTSLNSFHMYQPFSLKGKLFKKLAFFLVNLLPSALVTEAKKGSQFVSYLEEKLGQKVITSIYFSTDKSKIVLQVQAAKEQIILGYIKIGLTSCGNARIQNERRAISVLGSEHLCNPLSITYFGSFEEHEYLMLGYIKSESDKASQAASIKFLDRFKRESKFPLRNHPRMLSMYRILLRRGELKLVNYFLRALEESCEAYHLAYEHGDYAPWNIINHKESVVPIDFEHFVEDGIEYFDLIKYHYQYAKLILKHDALESIAYVKREVQIKELEIIFVLFIINEILLLSNEKQTCDLEYAIVKELQHNW